MNIFRFFPDPLSLKEHEIVISYYYDYWVCYCICCVFNDMFNGTLCTDKLLSGYISFKSLMKYLKTYNS